MKKNNIYFLMIFIFILVFILNMLTPILLDDYSYSLTFDQSRRIHNIFDIIQFLSIHYFRWGGRVLAHFIAQVFLLFPRWIFSIFNSLIFVIEGFLIYQLARIQNGKKKKDSLWNLIFIYLLLWFINPIFGQINLWLVGSCNYLWTMVVMLFYLHLFLMRKNNLFQNLLLFLFQYCISLGDFYKYFTFYKEREKEIYTAIKNNEDTVYLKIYDSNNSKIPTYLDLDDLSTKASSFPNNYMEKYYGISTIIGYERSDNYEK